MIIAPPRLMASPPLSWLMGPPPVRGAPSSGLMGPPPVRGLPRTPPPDPLVIVQAMLDATGVADCVAACEGLRMAASTNLERVLASDGPSAIVFALTAHAGSAAVCERGCKALIYFAASDAGKAACVAAGAPAAVVAALTTHAGVAAVC